MPVIRELLSQNTEVIIAGSGSSLKLLEKEFPDLESIKLPDYKLNFNSIISIGLTVALQCLKLSRKIKEENEALNTLLQKRKIHGIISDNRYGLFSENIPSVLISHQLKLAPSTPFKSVADKKLSKYLKRFTEIWVPDSKNSPLSGQLSINDDFKNKKYVGFLSRFSAAKEKRKNHVLITLSGTEPHRTNLENKIIKEFGNTSTEVILLRGKLLRKDRKVFPKNFTVHDHLNSTEFEKLLSSCKLLISRCGYSTLMDVIATETPVILFPTKGQSEQEYLAEKLKADHGYAISSQKHLKTTNLKYATPLKFSMDNSLSTVMRKWLDQL